jgi:hypothetical protein
MRTIDAVSGWVNGLGKLASSSLTENENQQP